MTHALTNFINDAGWLAPLYYVLAFVFTALVPVVPTPLVSALGGTAFGFWPALAYGIVGLGLGALVSLNLARRLGRPLLNLLIRREAWEEWQEILGIRALPLWGVVFFVLNLDFVVMLSGLTSLPLRGLWLTAVIARFPWLVITAWFGSTVLVSEAVMWLALALLVPGILLLNRLRPRLRHLLVRLSPTAKAHGGTVPEASVELPANDVGAPRASDETGPPGGA